MQAPPLTTVDALLDRYEALLLDAYGVLVTADGALPGATALIERLNAEGRPYFIVTNDASRLPESVAARFAALGLPVPAEHIITSGSLLAPFYAEHDLAGRATAVLGPEDSVAYVRQAGGEPVAPEDRFEVLVAADERGQPFLEAVNAALSSAYRHLDAGGELTLLLPNPDLIYPRGEGHFGFTAGGQALLLEHGLRLRYPEREDLRFTPLGKPRARIFREAVRRAGTASVVMVGDQLATDIAGANAAGIDSALIAGGVSAGAGDGNGPRPTWRLAALGRDRT